MSFGIPFQCSSVPGSNSSDLCLGGECAVSQNGEQSCVHCPAGWIQSDILGHFPNCGMPTLFLPIFFGIHTVVTCVGLFFSYRKTRTKKKSSRLYKLGMSWCVYMLSEWLRVLAFFLQGGLFLYSGLAYTLTLFTSSEVFIQYNMFFLSTCTPIMRSEEKLNALKFWRLIQVVTVTISSTFGIVMSVYSQEIPREYNVFFFVFLEMLFLQLASLVIPGAVLTQKFIRILNSLKPTGHHSQFVISSSLDKLKQAKRGMIAFIVFFCVFTQSQVLIYGMLGSVPYEFIIFILNHQNFQFLSVLPLLTDTSSSEVGSSQLSNTREAISPAKELLI